MSGEDLSSDPAGQDALRQWALDAGMETIPVLDAHNFSSWGAFEIDFGTPSIAHISPDMKILSIDDNIREPSQFLE